MVRYACMEVPGGFFEASVPPYTCRSCGALYVGETIRHNTLNSIDPNIQFTVERENNDKLAFLDTTISRRNEKLYIDAYRKPTHTYRYLDYNSHHERKHKISTARTLIHRALKLSNTEEGKTNELKHVTDALRANGYPLTTLNNIIKDMQSAHTSPSPEELVGMFFKNVDPPDTMQRN